MRQLEDCSCLLDGTRDTSALIDQSGLDAATVKEYLRETVVAVFVGSHDMKSYRKELWFEAPTRRAFINITRRRRGLPAREPGSGRSRAWSTRCTSRPPSSSTTTNRACITTTKSGSKQLAPHEPISQYQHNRTGEDNADAHLKRQIMGREVVVAITKGKLDFGPWEQIFYGEFDGRRRKRVLVKIIGE